MTPRDFCYWLQGYFELSAKGKIDANQIEIIKNHLAMGFATHIDPTFGDYQTREMLSKIHNGKVDSRPKC